MSRQRRRAGQGATLALLALLAATPSAALAVDASPEARLQASMNDGQGWLDRQWRRRRAYPVQDRVEQALARGDADAAIAELTRYLVQDPGHLPLRWRLVQLLQRQGRDAEAAAQAAQLLQRRPQFGPAQLAVAAAARARGEATPAHAAFLAALGDAELPPGAVHQALLGLLQTAGTADQAANAARLAATRSAMADAPLLLARASLALRRGDIAGGQQLLDAVAGQPAEQLRAAALAEATGLQQLGRMAASLALLRHEAVRSSFATASADQRLRHAQLVSVAAEQVQQREEAATAAAAAVALGDAAALPAAEQLAWRLRSARLTDAAAPAVALAALLTPAGTPLPQPAQASAAAWADYLLLLAELASRAGQQALGSSALAQLPPGSNRDWRLAQRIAAIELALGQPGRAQATLRPWRGAALAAAGADQAAALAMLVLRATAAHAAGDTAEWRASLQDAAAIDARVEAPIDQSRHLLAAGETAAAIAVLQTARDRQPEAPDPRLLFALAEAQRHGNDMTAAIASYRAGLMREDSWPMRWTLAELLRRQGDSAAAAQEYARLARSAPAPDQAQVAWLTLGDQHWAAGEATAALQAYETAIEAGAGIPARLRAAEAAFRLRQPAVLVRLLAPVLGDGRGLDSTAATAVWRQRYCTALLAGGERRLPGFCTPPVSAAQAAATRREQALAAAYAALGQGRARLAAEAFHALWQDQADPRAGVGLGEALQAEGRHDAAVEVLRRVLQQPGLVPEVERRAAAALGYAETRRGNHAEAAEAWQRALAVQPDATLALARTDALRRTGRLAEAGSLLEQVQAGMLSPAQRSDLAMQRTRLLLASGRADAAVAMADALVAEAASAPRLALLVEARGAAGDRAGAAAAAEQAVLAAPSDAEVLARAGYAQIANAAPARGAALLQQALRAEPGLDAPRMDLPYAQAQAGQWRDARAAYADAIRHAEAAPLPDAAAQARRLHDLRLGNAAATREFSAELATTLCLPGQAVGCRAPLTAAERLGSAGIGSALLGWTPHLPGIANREFVTLYARALWANQPGNLLPQGRSVQAGFGIRLRPVAEVPLYLWAERMVALGREAQDNWLLRVTAGWETGPGWQAGDGGWSPYGSVYGDLSHLLARQRNWMGVAELRAGASWQPLEQLRVVPHAFLRGEMDHGRDGNSHALMLGAGIALRGRLLQDPLLGYALAPEALLRVAQDLDRSGAKRGTRLLFGLALRY